MSAFEYVTIPISIVLALGLGKLLTTVILVLETGKRDWVHLLWCITLIMVMLAQWLAVWQLSANEVWTAVEFLVVLLSPILFFTAAQVLISSRPELVTSWADHLQRMARPILLLMIANLLNFNLRTYLILGEVRFTTSGWVYGFLLLINVAALVFPRRWLLVLAGLSWMLPVVRLIWGFEIT